MRPIPKTFKKGKFTHRLIKRKDDVALYDKTSSAGGTTTFEIHKVRNFKAHTRKYRKPDGGLIVVDVPNREMLAGNEDFGCYGWSADTKEYAEEIFAEMVERFKQNRTFSSRFSANHKTFG